MAIKVIGAGYGRTGTLSLKFALEKLGFDKCYHMMEVQMNPQHLDIWRKAAAGDMPDWHALYDGYQASVDWPSCNFWREQLQAFPNAKVILSRRDSEQWYKSIMNTIWPSSSAGENAEDPRRRGGAQMAFEVIWEPIFQRRMEDKDHVIARYEAHCADVIESVPAKQLLVYEPGQGWGPLCEFLGCDEPSEDYPSVNSTEEFTARWRQIAKDAEQPG